MTAGVTATHAGGRADGPERLLQRGFLAWLAAATVSATGDGVLYFAVAWTATGLGAGVATLVMAAGLVTEIVFTLAGGVAADRWGVRRTVVGCAAAMAVMVVVLLAALVAGVPMAPLLVAVAVATGVVFSFQTPASNVLPRLFFPDHLVPRAMALTGSVLPFARLVGPPLGAVVVAALSLAGALTVDLASCLIVLAVLVVVRPRHEPASVPVTDSVLAEVRAGLRAVGRVPGVVPLLGSLALVAGGLLPLLSLGVPLLVRERGWAATDAGLIEACWIAGTLAVTVLVSRTGTSDRSAVPLTAGPVLAAVGAMALSMASLPALACVAAVGMGVGTAVFTTQFFPLYVLRSPADMMARFQSVLVLVQMVVMLLGNVALGSVTSRWGVGPALVGSAVVCALAAVPVLATRSLRAPSVTPVGVGT